MNKESDDRIGLTMVEVMIVAIIIALLTMMAWPAYQKVKKQISERPKMEKKIK